MKHRRRSTWLHFFFGLLLVFVLDTDQKNLIDRNSEILHGTKSKFVCHQSLSITSRSAVSLSPDTEVKAI